MKTGRNNTKIGVLERPDTDEVISQLKSLTKEFEAHSVKVKRITLAAVELLLAASDVLDYDTVNAFEDPKNYLSKELSEETNDVTVTEESEVTSAGAEAA